MEIIPTMALVTGPTDSYRSFSSFYRAVSQYTTISSSAILFNGDSLNESNLHFEFALIPLSTFMPWLISNPNINSDTLVLQTNTQCHILSDAHDDASNYFPKWATNNQDNGKDTSGFSVRKCEIVSLVTIPALAQSLDILLNKANATSGGVWSLGWSLDAVTPHPIDLAASLGKDDFSGPTEAHQDPPSSSSSPSSRHRSPSRCGQQPRGQLDSNSLSHPPLLSTLLEAASVAVRFEDASWSSAASSPGPTSRPIQRFEFLRSGSAVSSFVLVRLIPSPSPLPSSSCSTPPPFSSSSDPSLPSALRAFKDALLLQVQQQEILDESLLAGQANQRWTAEESICGGEENGSARAKGDGGRGDGGRGGGDEKRGKTRKGLRRCQILEKQLTATLPASNSSSFSNPSSSFNDPLPCSNSSASHLSPSTPASLSASPTSASHGSRRATRIRRLGHSKLSLEAPRFSGSRSRSRSSPSRLPDVLFPRESRFQDGEAIRIVGCPFGCLAPQHFMNCVVKGTVANAAFGPLTAEIPMMRQHPNHHRHHHGYGYACHEFSASSSSSLLSSSSSPSSSLNPQNLIAALDANVFPGMEGALVLAVNPGGRRRGARNGKTGGYGAGNPIIVEEVSGEEDMEICSLDPDGDFDDCDCNDNYGADYEASPTNIICNNNTTPCAGNIDDPSKHTLVSGHQSFRPQLTPHRLQPRIQGVLIPPLIHQPSGSIQIPLAIPWIQVAAAVVKAAAHRAAFLYGLGRAAHGDAGIGASRAEGSDSVNPMTGDVPIVSTSPCSACVSVASTSSSHPISAASCRAVSSDNLSAASVQGARDAVVLIQVGRQWATGFLLGPQGYILTVGHVLHDVCPRYKESETFRGRGVGDADRNNANGDNTNANGGKNNNSDNDDSQNSGGRTSVIPEGRFRAEDWRRVKCVVRMKVSAQDSDGQMPSLSSSPSSPSTTFNNNAKNHSKWNTIQSLASNNNNAYTWLQAHVVYLFSNHLDVAILKLNHPPNPSPSLPRFLLPSLSHPTQAGMDVWCVGHGLFGPSAQLPPAVSHGVIAKVIRRRDGRPAMFVAGSATHRGGSGGPLVDSAGHVVGMATSNARHLSGKVMANLAFATPGEELDPIFRWVLQQQRGGGVDRRTSRVPGWFQETLPYDVRQLEQLDVYESEASRIWDLRERTTSDEKTLNGLGHADQRFTATSQHSRSKF